MDYLLSFVGSYNLCVTLKSLYIMTDNYCVELFKDLTIPRSFIHENPVL